MAYPYSNYFLVRSQFDLTDVAEDLSRDFKRAVAKGTIGQEDLVDVAIADTSLATIASTSNEVTKLTVNATGGTFTITYATLTTAALAYNISAADLQTALSGLAAIGSGQVVVSGGPGDGTGSTPYYIEWVGALAATNVAAPTTTATSLTGGAGTATVATLIAGGTVGA